MQVSRVNKVFARLGRFQIKFRWLILLATILVTLAACLGLPQLQMTASEEEWFDDWDKVKIDQAHFNDVFGSDDGYMVMVRANDVFAPEVLSAIDRLSRSRTTYPSLSRTMRALKSLTRSKAAFQQIQHNLPPRNRSS